MKPTLTPTIIRAECVHVDRKDRVLIGAPRPEAQIEVIREGDVIRAIEVVCPCGEKIRILCDFE